MSTVATNARIIDLIDHLNGLPSSLEYFSIIIRAFVAVLIVASLRYAENQVFGFPKFIFCTGLFLSITA